MKDIILAIGACCAMLSCLAWFMLSESWVIKTLCIYGILSVSYICSGNNPDNKDNNPPKKNLDS